MTNIEKYNSQFINCLHIEEAQLSGLTYQSIKTWDSVGHMSLMAGIEGAFDISLEMDDIIDFSSFEKGKQILKKYNVEL